VTDAAKPGANPQGMPDPVTADAATEAAPADANAGMGMGMMGGMGAFGAGPGGRRGAAPKPVEIKYEATAWGRYAKVLLSSTEFLFIN
jgi:hypothetical protein